MVNFVVSLLNVMNQIIGIRTHEDGRPRRHLTEEERLFIYQEWVTAKPPNRYEKVKVLFEQRFGISSPSLPAILNIEKKMIRYRTLKNVHRDHSGRKKTEAFREEVRRQLPSGQVTKTSIRLITQASTQVGSITPVARNTVWRITKEFNMMAYKPKCVQEVLPRHFPGRVEFCRWYVNHTSDDSLVFADNILFSDESLFTVSDLCKERKARYYAERNPNKANDIPHRAGQVMVWLGVSIRGLVGPIFVSGRLNGEEYQRLLTEDILPAIQNLYPDYECWFQQDGARAHTSGDSIRLLVERFQGRLISANLRRVRAPTRFPCFPAFSPDLAVLDYFVWPYLKEKVSKLKPQKRNELENAIRRGVTEMATEAEMVKIRRAIKNLRKRSLMCLARGGQTFEQYKNEQDQTALIQDYLARQHSPQQA